MFLGFEFGNLLNGWVWNPKQDVSPSTVKTDGNKSIAKSVSHNLSESKGIESKGMDSKSSSLEGTLAQRKSFFQRNSNSQSLFDLAKRSERSGKSISLVEFHSCLTFRCGFIQDISIAPLPSPLLLRDAPDDSIDTVSELTCHSATGNYE